MYRRNRALDRIPRERAGGWAFSPGRSPVNNSEIWRTFSNALNEDCPALVAFRRVSNVAGTVASCQNPNQRNSNPRLDHQAGREGGRNNMERGFQFSKGLLSIVMLTVAIPFSLMGQGAKSTFVG